MRFRATCEGGLLMAEQKAGKAARFENPLMPDERLRQMYTAMVQMRMLEEHLRRAAKRGAAKRETVFGEEAARASTALSLEKGDMISDCSDTAAMDLLMGVGLQELKRPRDAAAAAPRTGGAEYPYRLEAAGDRMRSSLGAAAALKLQGCGRVLLVYLPADRPMGSQARWRETLEVAARMELPLIVVKLPTSPGGRSTDLRMGSQRWGVPGFPVDGSDAIALYRVMQESLLRARSGGGAALIECIRFAVEGRDRAKIEDPIERLAGLLKLKGVASEGWISRTRSAFARRLTRGGR